MISKLCVSLSIHKNLSENKHSYLLENLARKKQSFYSFLKTVGATENVSTDIFNKLLFKLGLYDISKNR